MQAIVVAKRRPGICVLQLAGAMALAACSETALNDAPVIDLSTRAGTTVPRLLGAGADASQGMYTVQKGDTLYKIAGNFHVSVVDIARWSGIAEGAPIFVGQRLRIAPPGAAATAGQSSAPPGETAAAPDEAEVHAIVPGGGASVETHELAATPLVPLVPLAPQVPSALPPAAGVPELSAPGGAAATEAAAGAPPVLASAGGAGVTWLWPVEGKIVTAFDPVRTKGVDIAASEDAQVRAAADGEVSYTGSPREYGNLIVLLHADGVRTAYAHVKSILVRQGQTVTRGQAIATAGANGNAAPLVHFEVRRKGVPVNPLDVLPAR